MAKKPPKGELNDRQTKFLEHYLASNNATEAAKKAGYSHKTAEVIGCRLLRNVHIAAAIASRTGKALEKLEITTDRVLGELATMGLSNILDYLDVDKYGRPSLNLGKCTRQQAAAIKSIKITELPPMTIVENGQELQREVLKTEVTLWDKNSAVGTLADHLGLTSPARGEAPTQNNFYMMPPLEQMKRIAFMLSRPAIEHQPSGGNNGGSSAVNSATGNREIKE